MIPRETKLPRDYEVMDAVLARGDAVELARLLSVSPQLVRAWCRPPETEDEYSTGKFGPLARIRTLISMIRLDDGNAERAYPIGRYFAALLGGVFVPSPAVSPNVDSNAIGHVSKVLKETGEALEVFRTAWFEQSPKEIDSKEAAKTKAEIDEAIVALVHLRNFVNSKTK
ncbi:MAG: phage regulatory CII family protein [Desulfopila sp.]